MNKDINHILMALVVICRMAGEKIKRIEAVQDWYMHDGQEHMKEVAEITYDNGGRRYADIACDSNLTAVYDVVAVIQGIKPRSCAIERIVRDVYDFPSDKYRILQDHAPLPLAEKFADYRDLKRYEERKR